MSVMQSIQSMRILAKYKTTQQTTVDREATIDLDPKQETTVVPAAAHEMKTQQKYATINKTMTMTETLIVTIVTANHTAHAPNKTTMNVGIIL